MTRRRFLTVLAMAAPFVVIPASAYAEPDSNPVWRVVPAAGFDGGFSGGWTARRERIR